MPTTDGQSASPPSARPASLGLVLGATFLLSVGTGVVSNGIFFITREQFGYSRTWNLALAAGINAIYIAGALGVGPALRRLARRSARVTTRRVLLALISVMGVVATLPAIIEAQWTVWLVAALYGPVAGGMWPIVESYLSGGRRGADLRRAIGGFNLGWALAVAAAYWGMGAVLEVRPLLAIGGMGALYLCCLPLIWRLPNDPARHADLHGEAHPPVYERLLPVFRWLLILSYVLIGVVAPLLPDRMEALGMSARWGAMAASAWAISRIAMFWLFRHWGGWHGRWRTPFWTGGGMIGGMILTLSSTGLAGALLGLVLFGVGVGGVYAAALYYAMSVGAAEVDAGGKHEAMIGLGYTIGPIAGLAGAALASGEGAVVSSPDTGAIAVVSLVTLVGLIAAARAGRSRRSGGSLT